MISGDQRKGLHAEGAEVRHEHAGAGEDGDLVRVTGKGGVQGAARDVHEGVAHGHAHIGDVGVHQRTAESVIEAQDGEAHERNATEDEPGAVFAPLRVALVHDGAHDRVPQDVHEADDEEHQGGRARIQSEHVRVEEQQPDGDGLVDEVLRHVAGAEADALGPAQLVEAFGFVVCHIV